MTAYVRIRVGRADEAGALSELALRSKAHWGYDASFLADSRRQLVLRPGEVADRRVAVAEQAGRVVGFATLESDGDGRAGVLGMLFVAPEQFGRGIGARLYRHVLDEAGRLGFDRVVFEADPHAEGFYLRMGAGRRSVGPGRGLVPMVAFPPRPEPGWVAAWSGGSGGRAVHLGNVAEFNGQFDTTVPVGAGPVRQDHYACTAVFASTWPALVVLPQHVGQTRQRRHQEHHHCQWWVRGLADRLAWGDVDVYGVEPGPEGLCAAVASRPALLKRIRAGGLPVLPWGRTEQAERLLAGPGAGSALRVTRQYESKAAAHRLFRRLADGRPRVIVPEQRSVGSARELARALSERASAGLTSVVKAEPGVGGSATWILTPRRLRRKGAARAVVRALPPQARLLEDHVDGGGPVRPRTLV